MVSPAGTQGLVRQQGRAEGLTGGGGSPDPSLVGLSAQPLAPAALALMLLVWTEDLSQPRCVCLDGLGDFPQIVLAQISLYILLKSSFHYDSLSPFHLQFSKDLVVAGSQDQEGRPSVRGTGWRSFINCSLTH